MERIFFIFDAFLRYVINQSSEAGLDTEGEGVADRIRVVAPHFRIVADIVGQRAEVLRIERDREAAELDGLGGRVGKQV